MKQIETTDRLVNDLPFLAPYFLGAYGENSQVFKNLLVEFVSDHINWRKEYHPDDKHPVSVPITRSPHYIDTIARISKELHSLAEKLKRTIPIYNPRYLGHMASDLSLPALLAQLVATLYNPNNSAADAAEVTIEMELDVGNQFAKMFGFNTNPEQYPCAWGHLTSGGSDANYECLWNFRAVKYYPVALVQALEIMQIEVIFEDKELKSPFNLSPWELTNLSIDTVLKLRKRIFHRIKSELGTATLKEYSRLVEDNRLETLGPAQFFAEHWKFHQPVVLVPATAYKFWEKAMRLLGFGSASLIQVPVTHAMRMDAQELERILHQLQNQHIPVLAIIGVLGTLEFGTIDPIHSMVKLQQELDNTGFHFYLHVDASRGGYLKALFKDGKGNSLSRESIGSDFNYFPSEANFKAFMSLSAVDSITISPHNFGYLPQGIGGFIARNREIVKLLNHSEKNLLENGDTLDLSQLSRFILDGAKPGASAAAAYLTHKVLPLNADHFGRVVKQTIRSSEYFFNKIGELKAKLTGKAHVCIPVEPDTNLVTLAINPVGNHSLVAMNEFLDKIYRVLAYNPNHTVQTKEFLGSTTHLDLHYFTEQEKVNLLRMLDIHVGDISKFTEEKVHILCHTLVNPWLGSENEGMNYLDQYCDFLEKTITELIKVRD